MRRRLSTSASPLERAVEGKAQPPCAGGDRWPGRAQGRRVANIGQVRDQDPSGTSGGEVVDDPGEAVSSARGHRLAATRPGAQQVVGPAPHDVEGSRIEPARARGEKGVGLPAQVRGRAGHPCTADGEVGAAKPRGRRVTASRWATCSTQTGPSEKRPALPLSERLSPITTRPLKEGLGLGRRHGTSDEGRRTPGERTALAQA